MWSFFTVSWLCLLLTAVFYLVWQRWKLIKIINRMPGLRGLPILGNSMQLWVGREDVMATLYNIGSIFHEQNQPLFRLWMGPVPIVVIIRAEAAKAILNSNILIDKSSQYNFLSNWLGTGLLTSTGSKWQRRRKLITPAFHFRILERFLLVMNEQANILVQILDKKCKDIDYGQFDIYPYITTCTLDIICETAMGQGVQAQLNADSKYVNAINTVGYSAFTRMSRPWLHPQFIYKHSALGKQEQRAIDIIHGFTNKIIKLKRMKLKESGSQQQLNAAEDDESVGSKRRVALLDLLLENSQQNTSQGPALTDEDILEEVETFMFEGHDTTAVGISWALFLIGMHPQVQQKIVNELKQVFGNSDADATSTDLLSLKYLECVIKESLRLFTPVPMYGRKLREETEICGFKIPAKVDVAIIPHLIQTDPAYFEEPRTFNPDRFLSHHERDPFSYVPFSAGPRNCIGQKFALMEEKVVLSRILRKFQVTTTTEASLADVSRLIAMASPELTLKPRDNMPMIFQLRH